jgi:hypothetical protein
LSPIANSPTSVNFVVPSAPPARPAHPPQITKETIQRPSTLLERKTSGSSSGSVEHQKISLGTTSGKLRPTELNPARAVPKTSTASNKLELSSGIQRPKSSTHSLQTDRPLLSTGHRQKPGSATRQSVDNSNLMQAPSIPARQIDPRNDLYNDQPPSSGSSKAQSLPPVVQQKAEEPIKQESQVKR